MLDCVAHMKYSVSIHLSSFYSCSFSFFIIYKLELFFISQTNEEITGPLSEESKTRTEPVNPGSLISNIVPYSEKLPEKIKITWRKKCPRILVK